MVFGEIRSLEDFRKLAKPRHNADGTHLVYFIFDDETENEIFVDRRLFDSICLDPDTRISLEEYMLRTIDEIDHSGVRGICREIKL